MKVHIEVDKNSGLIHSVETTSANLHDITRAVQLPGSIRSYPQECSLLGSRHPRSLSSPHDVVSLGGVPSVIDQIPSSRRALIARLRSVARI